MTDAGYCPHHICLHQLTWKL